MLPPEILIEEYPLTLKSAQSVIDGRVGAEKIIKGEDDRLLVIVGPCSVHDIKAAIEYAHLLQKYAAQAKDDLHIIMRCASFRLLRSSRSFLLLNSDAFYSLKRVYVSSKARL